MNLFKRSAKPLFFAAVMLLASCSDDPVTPDKPDPDPTPVPTDPGSDDPPVYTSAVPDSILFTLIDQRLVLDDQIEDDQGNTVIATISAESSNGSIAGAYGRFVYPQGNGETTVVVTTAIDTIMLTDTLNVTVKIVPAALTIITPAPGAGILTGDILRLNVEVRDVKGRAFFPVQPPDSLRNEVVWSSTDESAAVVDDRGTVRGLAPGFATIRASWRGLESEVRLMTSSPIQFPTRQIPTRNTVGPGVREIDMDPDGNLYYITQHYRVDELVALNGTVEGERWSEILSEGHNLEIAEDGTVHYFDHGIHARRPDGTLIWRNSNCEFAGKLVVAKSGLYCVKAGSYYDQSPRLIAISEDGDLRWTFEEAGVRTVAVDDDGLPYLGTSDLIALNVDGSIRWRAPLPAPALDLLTDAGGNIFASTQDDRIGAFDSAGSQLWVNGDAGSPMKLEGADRLIATDRQSGEFVLLDRTTGAEIWREAHPAAGGEFFVAADNRLYALAACYTFVIDLSTGKPLGRSTEGICSRVGAISKGDKLYLPSDPIYEITLPAQVTGGG